MGYKKQIELIYNTIERFPQFKNVILNFRKNWHKNNYYFERIIIKGQPISDKVIRDMDLECLK